MKYRDIAKAILIKRGADERVRDSDAELVGKELAEDREAFTPKQTKKIQEALNDLRDSLKKKWKIA